MCGHPTPNGERQYYAVQTKQHFRQAAAAAIATARSAPELEVVALTWDNYYRYYLRKLDAPFGVDHAVSQSRDVVRAAERAWKRGAKHVLVLWGHRRLSNNDLKKLVAKRRVVKDKKMPGAGFILLARE